jgi:hypothetical protein
MKRVAVFAVVAALSGSSTGAAAPRNPGRMQISSQEFTLTASRHVLVAGPAIIELYNLGQDAHDLVIQRVGAAEPTARYEAIETGGVVDKRVMLQPGRYVAYCSLPGHRALGMQTTFTVVKPARLRRGR